MEALDNCVLEFLFRRCFQKVVISIEWSGTIRFDVNLKLQKKSLHSYKTSHCNTVTLVGKSRDNR